MPPLPLKMSATVSDSVFVTYAYLPSLLTSSQQAARPPLRTSPMRVSARCLPQEWRQLALPVEFEAVDVAASLVDRVQHVVAARETDREVAAGRHVGDELQAVMPRAERADGVVAVVHDEHQVTVL